MTSKTITYKYDLGDTFYYKLNSVIHYGVIIGVRQDICYGWNGQNWQNLQHHVNDKKFESTYVRYVLLNEKGRLDYVYEKDIDKAILPDSMEALEKAFM